MQQLALTVPAEQARLLKHQPTAGLFFNHSTFTLDMLHRQHTLVMGSTVCIVVSTTCCFLMLTEPACLLCFCVFNVPGYAGHYSIDCSFSQCCTAY